MLSISAQIQQLLLFPGHLFQRPPVIPILTGPARGMWWSVSVRPRAHWLGTYERDKQQRFVQFVRRGDCVFDIGAHAGYFSLLASRLVGPNGRLVAFEPCPTNLQLLQRHFALNGIENAQVIGKAVAEHEGESRFSRGKASQMGHISTDGEDIVSTVTLDGLWTARQIPSPSLIKIDVEGAEGAVLRGASTLFAHCRPVVLLSGHGSPRQRECEAFLRDRGYEIIIDRDGSQDGMYESVDVPKSARL